MLKEKIMLLETTSHQVVKVHGQPSMGHHQLQLLIHFSFPTTYSSTLGVFQIVLSNMFGVCELDFKQNVY